MKSLLEVINEGNITNIERQYREFCEIIKAHNHSCEDVYVVQSSKKNWIVYDKNTNKKICLVSRYILNDETVAARNLAKEDKPE